MQRPQLCVRTQCRSCARPALPDLSRSTPGTRVGGCLDRSHSRADVEEPADQLDRHGQVRFAEYGVLM